MCSRYYLASFDKNFSSGPRVPQSSASETVSPRVLCLWVCHLCLNTELWLARCWMRGANFLLFSNLSGPLILAWDLICRQSKYCVMKLSSWFPTIWRVTLHWPIMTGCRPCSSHHNGPNTSLGNRVCFSGHSFRSCDGQNVSLAVPVLVSSGTHESLCILVVRLSAQMRR